MISVQVWACYYMCAVLLQCVPCEAANFTAALAAALLLLLLLLLDVCHAAAVCTL